MTIEHPILDQSRPVEPCGSSETEPQPPGLIIGITGLYHKIGSSTTARLLSEVLGFCYRYAGGQRREMANQWYQEQKNQGLITHQMTESVILDVYEDWLHQPENMVILNEVDKEIDTSTLKEALAGALKQGGCVFEGKAAVPLSHTGFFEDISNQELKPEQPKPPVVTILLTADPKVVAQRAISDAKAKGEEKVEDEEQIIVSLDQRMQRNMETFKKLYGLDIDNLEQYYDLIIDTTNLSEREVVSKILKSLLSQNQFSLLISEHTKARIAQEYPEIESLI